MNEQAERIVVGYDGSAQAARAVEWAAVEAVRREQPLIVFYVIDYGRFATGGGGGVGTDWRPYLAQDPAQLLVDKGTRWHARPLPRCG
jgi:nucleotide-binding universal stress UspA family protein